MSDMLVPPDPALVEIRTVDGLILLYQSRLNDPSITSLCEVMLMTRSYQLQAFALALELVGACATWSAKPPGSQAKARS